MGSSQSPHSDNDGACLSLRHRAAYQPQSRPLATADPPPRPQEDDSTGKIATAGSVISGAVLAVGWYVFMGFYLLPSSDPTQYSWDCNSMNATVAVAPCGMTNGAYWAPGILATFGLIMLNIISWEGLTEDGLTGDEGTACKLKVWVTVSFVVLFCSLGGALWILIADGIARQDNPRIWMGISIAVLVQNACIFLSALIFRVTRRSGDHSF